MKKITILLLFMSAFGYSQIGVGTTAPDATLDVVATNPTGASTAVDGILIPRVDRQRAQSMTGTITSTMIFVNSIATGTPAGTAINITSTGFYYYDGSVWQKLATGASNDWALTGNTGTTAGANFIGTTDATDIRIKTAGNDRWNISNANNGQLQSYSLGTAALPTFSFQGDTNTGLFSSGADALDLSTGGTARIRIPNANQVHALSLGTAALPFYSFSADPDTGLYSSAANSLDFSTNGTARVQIDANGNVGIATAPTASSVLDMSSVTNKAMEAPNVGLTAANVATIAAPATGALIYNTATAGTGANAVTPGYYYWNGARWVAFTGAGGNDWSLTGNAGTSAATNYVGTTDAVDFRLATNGLERMRVIQGTGAVIMPGFSTTPVAGDRFSVYNTAAGAASDYAINGYSTSTGVGTYGQNTGGGYGVYGLNNSTGIAVRAANTGLGNGVYATSTLGTGNLGAGVNGVANTATGVGVFGGSSGAGGTGVWGNVTGNTGASGIYGQSTGNGGTGVFGYTNGGGNSDGIYGETTAGGRFGVWGVNNSNTGVGVRGSSTGNNGYGVYGNETQAARPGVYGINDNNTGYGVYGTSVGTSGTGVYGTSTGATGYGVYGIQTQALRSGVYGINDNATGNGVQGTTLGVTGYGVYGIANGASGNGVYGTSTGTNGYGIYGTSTGTNGVGVYGTENQAARYGVWGTNNNNTGFGVVGTTSGTTAVGVNGTTTGVDATAVTGFSSGANADGVYGQASGATGYGVWGLNNNNTGNGAVGSSTGTTGNGVLGIATGTTGYGVYGTSTGVDGTAVFGSSTGANADGVYGQATGATAYGVWGVNNNASGIGTVGNSTGTNGIGVSGLATGSNGVGVSGTATTAINGAISGRNLDAAGTGIIASGNNAGGVYLVSGSGGAFNGIPYGSASWATDTASGIGVAGAGNNQSVTTIGTTGAGGAFTGNQWALTGVATITGAGNDATDRGVLIGNYVSGGSTIDDVYVGARIAGVNYKILGTGGGSVSTTMKTSQGERILFAPEATENWFFDMGEVELVNGKATVNLDPIFVETLSDSKPFKVFVQGGENTLGSIRISRNQSDKSFVVEDLGGASNGTVQYSVYGIWKGKENLRLPELKAEDRPKQVVVQNKQLNNNSNNAVVERTQAADKSKANQGKLKNIEPTKEISMAAAEQEKRTAVADKTEPVKNSDPARNKETEAAVENSRTTGDRTVKEMDEKQQELKIK